MKFLSILIFLLFNFSFSQLRLGFDVNGESDMSGYGLESISSTDDGFTIGYESIFKTDKELTYGIGGEFMFTRAIDEGTRRFGFN